MIEFEVISSKAIALLLIATGGVPATISFSLKISKADWLEDREA